LPSTVLVTGGAGFIGSHVVPMLLERGDRVRLLDNMTRGDRQRIAAWQETGRVELIEQDVRYGNAVHAATVGCDAVVHLAAVSINKSLADPHESVDINLVGTNNVLSAAADLGVRRVVYASSASVYGNPRKLPMSEDDLPAPLTPYCISKLAGEHLADFFARGSAMTWIGLRFFNVYGPGQKTTAYYTSVINHFVARLRAGEPPVIDGEGKQSMDFVHVHDIARAVVMALDADPAKANTVVNVGTGISTTVEELARTLIAAVGVDVEPQFAPRDVLVSRRAADIRRAADVLGWAPTIDVATGMKDLVDREIGAR
jgi:UDP-glucose 4-epimerase